MDFIRGAVVTLFGFVMVIGIVFMNISMTFASSLEYDTLKPALGDSAKEVISNMINLNDISREGKNACKFDSEYFLEYNDKRFEIPCEIIEQGKESIEGYILDNFIDEIYYSNYDCEFWECVKESDIPFVLISDKARVYWASRAVLLAAMSFILFLLIVLVSNKRPSKFISTGVLLALCSLPFKNIDWVAKIVPAQVAPLFLLLSQKAHSTFMIMLFISAGLVLIGIVALIFGWNMKFNKGTSEKKITTDVKVKSVSREEVREIVKEELAKSNVPKKKPLKTKTSKKK